MSVYSIINFKDHKFERDQRAVYRELEEMKGELDTDIYIY